MSKPDIIRAWKDAAYRDSLSAAECATSPDNPVGALGPPAAAGRKYAVKSRPISHCSHRLIDFACLMVCGTHMAADLWMVLTWEITDFLECLAQLHKPSLPIRSTDFYWR